MNSVYIYTIDHLTILEKQNTDYLNQISYLTITLDIDLKKLQKIIDKFQNLILLRISNTNLTTLSWDIFNKLRKLTILELRYNKLTRLADNIGILVLLEILVLSYNQLSSLPNSIDNLVLLKELELNNNQLSSLPKSLGNLVLLKELKLRHNQLKILPESFGNLVLLRELVLSYNQLSSLPKSFGNLVSLEILELNNNQLEILPESFGKLVLLRELYLDNNQLKILPESFGNLESLERLQLDNNINLTISQFIINGNLKPDIKTYLQKGDFNGNGYKYRKEAPDIETQMTCSERPVGNAGGRCDVCEDNDNISDIITFDKIPKGEGLCIDKQCYGHSSLDEALTKNPLNGLPHNRAPYTKQDLDLALKTKLNCRMAAPDAVDAADDGAADDGVVAPNGGKKRQTRKARRTSKAIIRKARRTSKAIIRKARRTRKAIIRKARRTRKPRTKKY